MFRTLKLAAALLLAGSVSAAAATVEFVPTNVAAGTVYSTNSNDGWSMRRGIGFAVSSEQVISSVGLLQNVTGQTLSYWIYEISSLTSNFSRGAQLRSGSALTTTSGLDWVDFSFADLTLSTGKNYLIEFGFLGASNQNFFYNNQNVAWSQGAFTSLEGTAGSGFDNFVVGAFRVGDADVVSVEPVPLPAGLPLLIGGLAALGYAGRRRRRA